MNELWVVQNITDTDFDIKWAGQVTLIKAGEKRVVPEYLADHFAKHLINQILTSEKKMVSDEQYRAPLMKKIKIKPADAPDAPTPTEIKVTTIEERESLLAKREDHLTMTSQRVEEQSKKLTELTEAYEKRMKALTEKEQAVKIRELKLAERELKS